MRSISGRTNWTPSDCWNPRPNQLSPKMEKNTDLRQQPSLELHGMEFCAKPHKCPACDGTGLVSRPPWIAGDVNIYSTDGTGSYSCRACSGSGILWC